MFQYIYVLENITGDLYVGCTNNLQRRLEEHNRKRKLYPKANKGPWRIIHVEYYLNPKDAWRREKYLKTSQGIRLLKRMLKEYFYSRRSRISTTR